MEQPGGLSMRINESHWGELDGRPVSLIEMESKGLRARVSNYGGILQSLELSGMDVVLGYDTLEAYRRSDAYFGAMIGPVADRIEGGRCVLDGREIQLFRNAGPDCNHSGDLGFHRRLWDWEPMEQGLRLYRAFDDDALGFPGALSVEIRYLIPNPLTLRLEYEATCTRQTAVSITHHSYFNLTGGRTDCCGHVLTVHADRYAETKREADPICTGRALPVDGTPLDLRGGVQAGDIVSRTDFREIAVAGGLDHYFPIEGESLRELARLHCPDSGLTLRCASDAPGLLIYAGNGLSGETGKGGQRYFRNWGVCLEAERFPNAVNLPSRRSGVLLEPGETYASVTEFRFGRG